MADAAAAACCLLNLLLSNPTHNPRLFDSVFPSEPSVRRFCPVAALCVFVFSVPAMCCPVFSIGCKGAQSADCCVPCQHCMWAALLHALCAFGRSGCRPSLGSCCCLRLAEAACAACFRACNHTGVGCIIGCTGRVCVFCSVECVRFGWRSLIPPLALLHVAFFSPASTVSHAQRCRTGVGPQMRRREADPHGGRHQGWAAGTVAAGWEGVGPRASRPRIAVGPQRSSKDAKPFTFLFPTPS